MSTTTETIQQPGQTGKKQRNTIGLIALVIAVLGFIFAVWEGAYLLGWILLPIAFVLSLVAMFKKGQPKGSAIAALIISIVGTIAGGLAFASSAVDAIDDAFNEAPAVVDTDADTDAAAVADTDDRDGTADEAAAGTRDNPLPLGTSVATEDWELTVNSFTPDATDEVLAANMFNEEPDEGHVYALVNVTAKRLASESGTTMEISLAYVTEGGNVLSTADAMAVAPEDLSIEELYEGAEATGNVVLMIPAGDAGTIRASAGLFADDVFYATS